MKSHTIKASKKQNSKNVIQSSNHKILLSPLIFIVAILPFIMHSYQFDSGLGQFTWFANDDTKVDIFLYYKQCFLLIACSVMLLFITCNILKKHLILSLTPALIPIFVYGILALLSTFLSEHLQFGFKGIYEQFESIFVLLGYCLIVYYAYLFVKNEGDVKLLLKYLLYSIIVFSIIGFLQILAFDPVVSNFGKKLYLGREYWDYLDKFTLSFSAHRVYLTLYNPNYVGSYTSLLIPVLSGLLVMEKGTKQKIFYSVGLMGMIICLIGSQSLTGMVAVAVTLLLFLFFFRKYIFKNKKIILSIVSICVIGILSLTALNKDKITTLLNKFNMQKTTPSLTNIETGDDLIITYKGEDLKISLLNEDNNFMLSITDQNNTPLSYTINEEGKYVLDSGNLSGIEISLIVYDNLLCINVKIDDKDWLFTNQTEDGTYYYVNSTGKLDKIISADSSLFTGYEKIASGRGYIWSRTIPLLRENILLGSGADSYIYTFPQQDYVNLYNAGFDGQVLTRPHNLFLQIGVQSGVLSLIAFFVFYFMYFISSIIIYKNGNYDSYLKYVGVSIFLGTIGYLITGISNDSTITVAPVFWVLIGTGIAINNIIRRKETK
jgi:hypothetical protein